MRFKKYDFFKIKNPKYYFIYMNLKSKIAFIYENKKNIYYFCQYI